MKKLAILMPNLNGGGAERVAVNLANKFSLLGYAVDMVLLSSTGQFLTELRSEIVVVDLKVKRLRNAVLPLASYFRQSRPDSVLACMWPLSVAAVCARKLSRIPFRLILSEHTTWSRAEILSRWSLGWQVSTSMHLFFPKADGIVTVSNGAADDLASFANLDRNAITVIYNPIVGYAKPQLSALRPPPEWWTGGHLKVLAVGTLKPIKDHQLLLEATALLRKRVDARLLILGEGECRTALEARAFLLNIDSSVFMPGFVNDPSPYFQQADLFVLSSKMEGFGNVIVEALAAGTPVVSTDCESGPREILSDGKFGLLTPVGDAVALSNAMAESLSTQHDHAALKGRAQYFTIDKSVDQYLELIFPG
jgi:glycosyltransferase involved in cell wall biosynthesis